MATQPIRRATIVTESGLGRAPAGESVWPYGWWRIVDLRVGFIPLPISVVLVAVGRFTCAELGKRLAIMGNIGAAAVLATVIPSAPAQVATRIGGAIVVTVTLIALPRFL